MVKKYYSKSVDNTRKLCYTIKVIKLQIYEKEVIDMKKILLMIQYIYQKNLKKVCTNAKIFDTMCNALVSLLFEIINLIFLFLL